MQDVQNQTDKRGIAIQRVGISETFLPICINDGNLNQNVTGKIKFTVDLPMEYKGTHMSRFQEILLNWHNRPINSSSIKLILQEALEKLGSNSAYLSIAFKYFLEKKAPISNKISLLDVDCKYSATILPNGKVSITLSIKIPATSLCPCSKEISKYGAHNQRSIISISINTTEEKIFSIKEIVELIEKQASCPVYPLLKREDEKYVTEKAYENPKFVEDILRDCVLALRSLDGINYFSVECENLESIHNHNAFASHMEYVSK